MHAPDGFLNAGTAIGTAVMSAGVIGVALRQSRQQLADRQTPLAGLTAAFVFAAQMFTFPVAAGTTGHLLGGVLAAVLLGPATATVVVATVILIQSLVFADGGITALGYNVLNMAVITSFGGYALFRGFRRLLPATASGVVMAGGLAAAASVVLAAMAFSLEWLFGATAPVPFDTVFGAMVGVHLLIGVGEGVITAMTLGAVLAARPDLVAGAADLDRAARSERPRWSGRGSVLAGVLTVTVLATVVSQFAWPQPDGLSRVAEDQGFSASGRAHPLATSIFADYATRGLGNPTLSLALAGGTGAALTAAVGTGILVSARDRRRPGPTRSPRPSPS
jgi:cobalt/nickel transport system permease protein